VNNQLLVASFVYRRICSLGGIVRFMAEPRTIHKLQIKLRTHDWCGAIVDLGDSVDPKTGGCLKLINSRKTWLTATVGDAVLLRADLKSDSWERHFIDSITLYRVYPADENDKCVSTAQAWLDGGE
jgi:hypothetical protein